MDHPRQDGHVVLLAPHREHEGGVNVDDLGDQIEVSIQVTWSVSTNQGSVLTNQYSGHVISIDQQEASIYLGGFLGRQEAQLHGSHASCGGALLRYIHVHGLKFRDDLNQQTFLTQGK